MARNMYTIHSVTFDTTQEGNFPENLHRVVYVIINKRSFESFHVFGSDFITLAVILVSDFFVF